MRSIIQELKRRHVLQTAAIYVAVAWAATEMLGFLLAALNFPTWTVTIVAILFVLGFPVAMFLAWAFDVTTDGIQRTVPGSAKGKLTISVAILFLLTSTVGLFYLVYPQGPKAGSQSVAPVFDPPENSIAVLPFVNMSQDPDNEYFSDGIAEELLHKLARSDTLRVTARTSSFQFRDRTLDARIIGVELGVAKILEGSVRRSGSRVRITVQLINTKDGYHDWSETYDREVSDIFKIQEEIAESVRDELIVRMAVTSRGVAGNAGASFARDLTAYDYYLRGRHALYRVAERDVHKSIELLKNAVNLDPRLARAWLTLAAAYSTLPSPPTRGVADDLVIESARKALEVDASLGEAHALIAGVEERRWHWRAAEVEFREALTLEPQNTGILRTYGLFLARTGLIQKSHDQLTTALALDPVSSETRHVIGLVMLIRDDSQSAMQNARMAKNSDYGGWQNDHSIVLLLFRRGEVEEARKFLAKERERHGSWFRPELILDALQVPALIPVASAELAAMQDDGRLAPDRAFIYQSWLGQSDEAYRSATIAFHERTFPFQDLWLPELSQVRQDSRFAGLMRRAGLLEYWETYGYPDICRPVNDSVLCD